MNGVVLRADSVVAGYDGVPAIRGIDIEVRAGEVVALLGPNGAGKTTTMLVLAGELPLIEGSVELFGRPASGRLEKRVREGLAYIPEGRSVFPQLTVAQNLRLGRGAPEEALRIGPVLDSIRSRRAGLLSGGEQQLLSVSRALAAGPKVVLADELSLGLAPMIVQRLLATIRAAADAGAGVLLVEQHAHQALAIADRGYVLRRGAVVMHGSGAELAASVDELAASYLAT